MCDCCDATGARGPSRRSLLKVAAVGAAVGAAALPVAGSLAAGRAYGATTATATDVTGTALATPAAGDAAFGLTWFAGDTHVHDDHSADGSFVRQTAGQGSPGNLGVADQVAQGERTGLAWMPLTDHRTYNQHWDPQWTSSAMLLLPGEEAQGSPHAVCLGAVEEVVDGAQPAGPTHRHTQQALWDTHAQGALWGTAHPVFRPDDPANRDVTGVDWIEAWNRASDPDEELEYAEARWNEGLRCGVTGGCDDHFRELWAVAGPGNPTTYVGLAALTERSLIDGLRAGRTAVGSGPEGALVTLEADLDGDGRFEALGGDEATARPGATGTLRVRLQRGSGTTVTVLQAPGRSAAAALAQMTGTLTDQTWTVPVTVPADGTWWRVEVRGPGRMAGLDTSNRDGYPGTVGQVTELNQLQAISPPVYAATGGPTVFRPSVAMPPGADPAGDDATAPVALGEPGGFTGFGDVSADAADGAVAHLVAERHRAGVTEVVYRRLPDGAPVVLSGAAGTARLPRVASTPGAAGAPSFVVVVWSEERSGQLPRRPDVMMRRSTDGGRTFGPAAAVTAVAAGCRAERPDVLLLADGTPVVAWQENTAAAPPAVAGVGSPASAFEVLVKVGSAAAVAVSRPGKTVAAPSAADTRTALYPASLFPSLALLGDGRVAVAWQDDRFDPDPLFTGHTNPTNPNAKPASTTDPDAWEPMVAVRGADGTWGAPVRVAPDATLAQRHPALAARADGLLVCVWDAKSSQASSGSDPVLRWASSADGGSTWTARGALDPPPGVGLQQRPRLAAVPGGAGLQVVWDDGRNADWRFRVRTATLPAGATAWTGARDLSTAGNALHPAVDGGRVTWTTDRGAAAQRDHTQRVVLSGAAVAAAAPLLPEVGVAALLPAAGLVAAGVALARARARSAD